MLDSRIIEEFLSYQERIHGLSGATIVTYWYACRQWVDFLEKHGVSDLKNVHADLFLAWIEHGAGKGLRDRTIESKIYAIRSFYEYVKTFYGYISPILKLPAFRAAPSPESNHLTVKECWAMFTAIKGNDLIARRNRLVIATLWSTGLRSRELLALQWGDLDLDNGVMLVRKGKGNRQRQLFLNERLRAMYKRFHRGIIATPATPVFCSYSCARPHDAPVKRLTLKGLVDIVREPAKSARIARKVNPMILRHTFATHMYESGVPLEEIKEMMGHTNKTETGIYIHVTLDAMRRILNKQASYRFIGKRAS